MINLEEYGFNERFRQLAAEFEGFDAARVTQQHAKIYKIITEQGEKKAVVSGKLMHAADGAQDFPAVGDWVMTEQTADGEAVIRQILARKSVFYRKAAGTSGEVQIVASNIDMVFICMSLNEDYNLRRLERYLTVSWDSMATPVIVLTKADLCDDIPQKLAEVESVGIGTDVIVCSCIDEDGYESVKEYIKPGRTIALLGSSGVGKSTLINRLIGEDVLATSGIRENDGRGRHTTTYRQLLLLPDGGIVIDTPGMRELQINTGSIDKAFEDIEHLSQRCRFKDCAHKSEPGCAVKQAVEDGELPRKRLESYMKLKKEAAYEGLGSKQLEQKKIDNMFGGKGELKQAKRYAKQKKRY